MADTPEAAGDAPAPQTEANPTPTTTEPTQAPAPDMHGFTSEELADMRKFFDANGSFEKIKSKISNPQPAPAPQPEAQPASEPTSQPQAQPVEQPQPKTPEGAITPQEFLAKQYFQALAGEEKYQAIAKGIAGGDYLKEMAAFGISALNPDGSINDSKVRMYLDLKAQTVPAKATSTEPDASTAPTVDYVAVGDKIENIDQAYKVIMQPGHPSMKLAEDFIRAHLNPDSQQKA